MQSNKKSFKGQKIFIGIDVHAADVPTTQYEQIMKTDKLPWSDTNLP